MLEGRCRGGVRTLAGVLVALALGAQPAQAQVPDPLAQGPYGYKKIEYSAGNLLITIPPLVVFLFFNRQIIAGMTAGAVKG